jgi:hypothetical protein
MANVQQYTRLLPLHDLGAINDWNHATANDLRLSKPHAMRPCTILRLRQRVISAQMCFRDILFHLLLLSFIMAYCLEGEQLIRYLGR